MLLLILCLHVKVFIVLCLRLIKVLSIFSKYGAFLPYFLKLDMFSIEKLKLEKCLDTLLADEIPHYLILLEKLY